MCLYKIEYMCDILCILYNIWRIVKMFLQHIEYRKTQEFMSIKNALNI